MSMGTPGLWLEHLGEVEKAALCGGGESEFKQTTWIKVVTYPLEAGVLGRDRVGDREAGDVNMR